MNKKVRLSMPSKGGGESQKFTNAPEVVTKDFNLGDEVFIKSSKKFPEGKKARIAQIMQPGFLFRVQVEGFPYLHGPYVAKELDACVKAPVVKPEVRAQVEESSEVPIQKAPSKFSLRRRRSITR